MIVLALRAVPAATSIGTEPGPVSLDALVDRIEAGHLEFVFVGERHGNGPVKRFAADLANLLVVRGHDVGLYVEGFRIGCDPLDSPCNRLATLFNLRAYRDLATSSLAPIHPIDPAGADRRAQQMAAAIAAGGESVRVVLLGTSHMIYAGEPDASYRVFGGHVAYPDPGDVAEAFPRDRSVTIGLATIDHLPTPYAVRAGGVGVDYTVETASTGSY